MIKTPKKILLVMPLSTIEWGSKNTGGVDSVCQIFVEQLVNNASDEFSYRILAIDPLKKESYTGERIALSRNVEVVWSPKGIKLLGKIPVPGIIYQAYKVRQQVLIFKPNVVNSHIWSCLIGFSRNIPSIVTLHAYKTIGRKSVSFLNDWFYVNALPSLSKLFGHKIICVGKGLKAAVEKNVKQEVRVIGNPIDTAYFCDINRKGYRQPLRLVTCALLKPKKQIEKVILLAQMLNDAGIDTELAIIGPPADKNYVKSLKSQIESGNLTSKVSFLGRLNKSEIITHYKKSDIGVFFSKEETFGLAPLEMLATGLPLLATEVGILAEQKSFFENLGVVFVDVNQAEQVLIKAQSLISSSYFPDVNKLKDEFSVVSVVKQYESLYEELSVTC
jgi:glycosyltransferase involved in cell wall biosynthesis